MEIQCLVIFNHFYNFSAPVTPFKDMADLKIKEVVDDQSK